MSNPYQIAGIADVWRKGKVAEGRLSGSRPPGRSSKKGCGCHHAECDGELSENTAEMRQRLICHVTPSFTDAEN